MNSRQNLYIVLSVFVLIIGTNYFLSYNSVSSLDEFVVIASGALVGLLYFFVLKSNQNSLASLSLLAKKVRDNPYFKEEKFNQLNQEVDLVEAFTDHLLSYLNQSTDFVNNIKAGKLTSGDEAGKELHHGALMQSLFELRTQLIKLEEDEKERNWVSEGMSSFVDILRKSNQSPEDFYDSIIKALVKYLNANQGSLFVSAENEEGRKVLKQVACYAYNRKKFREKEVEAGQGLVGQVYLEKETTFLKEIPKGYVHITSGLGEAPPRNILLVPFKLNENVECVLELASFHEFKDYQIQFLEKVGESIASTISSFKINESTKKLLKESQEQAEIMQAQEEELRQNMEELEATQENLQRESLEKAKVQGEVMKTRDFLQKVMNAIPDPIYVKDQEHKIVVVNEAFCIHHELQKEQLIGKNEYEIIMNDGAGDRRSKDEKLFNNRAETTIEERVKMREKEIFVISKKRVIEDEDGQLFMVGINHDISHMKEVEQELEKEKYLMDALMENATDYIYFKDQDSKFIKMCKQMLHIFNAKTLGDVVGRSDFDFFTAEHAQPAFDSEQEIIKTGKPVLNLVEKETWEDGRVSYVSTSKMALRNTLGEIIGTFGISRDITETKLMELKMEEREKMLTSLILITEACILLLDDEFQYQFISPAFASKFDLDPLDVEGKKISWFVHSDDEEALRNVMHKLQPFEEKVICFRHIGELGTYQKVEAIIKNCMDDPSLNGYVFRIK